MNNPYKTIYELRETIAELSERCREQEADIEELLKEREWISVKDRLPEIPSNSYTSETVVCLSENGSLYFSRLEANGFGQVGFITHWMPLPDPPKENEE